MYSLAEMAAWTPEEVLAHIRTEMPEGWALDYGPDRKVGGTFYARLSDAEGKERWFDREAELRLLLLDLFGWLAFKGQTAAHPAWSRKGEVDPNASIRAQRQPKAAPVPEPEDLDPAQVAEFYEKMRDKS